MTMKSNRYFLIGCAGLAMASCTSMDEINLESGTILSEQLQETYVVAPERAEAEFAGMFTRLGKPLTVFGTTSDRPDDFGFIAMAYSNDIEGADMVVVNNDYNWFSTCGEYSSRNADYANPYIRYKAPYNTIGDANSIISTFSGIEGPDALNKVAQARALRAYAYLSIAPAFQFRYETSADKPCVPLVTEETVDFTNNPRATVEKIYGQILSDLTFAIENLAGYDRGGNKMYIDQQVAYGLRARAYLNMGKWAEAASDAEKAAEGYTPASIADVSKPSFYNIADANWMWGYDMTSDIALIEPMATSSSWIGSFSGIGYAAGAQCYAQINVLLYDKISDTDVRKGWWVDADLHSPLLEGLTWGTATGQDIAPLRIQDVKEAFLPYTNVKFGARSIGTTTNDEDFPLMRVEEMLLIQAEGYAKSGKEQEARKILEDFVKTYRDPEYSIPSNRTLADEIWFQRRVELWGEGFGVFDAKRLGKPVVRFVEGKDSNWPDAFRFNLAADDPWLLMRFPQDEMNTNFGIVDNEGGTMPQTGAGASLKDGVTD